MNLTVLIPTWRRPQELANCLDGLGGQTRIPDEVIVVARGGDEETWALLEMRRRSGVLPLRPVQVDSPGVVQSLKAGCAQAEGDVVAITDDDAVPRPDWIERIELRFAEESAVGGVGGRDWVHEGEHVHDDSRLSVGKIRWYGRVIGNHHLGVGEARPVDILKGANMAFRHEAPKGVSLAEGLRDGGAQVHFEMDLSLAIKRAGWRLLYDPAIAVDHYPARRFDEDQRERRSLAAIQNEIYNSTYVLATRLPLRRAALPLVYALLVGTRQAPGPLVALEQAARGRRPGARVRDCTRPRIEALIGVLRDGRASAPDS